MVKRIRSNRLARLIPLLATLAVMSCILDGPLDEARETQIILTVDAEVKGVGEDFSFTYDAQGTALNRVVVEFGDGASQADSTFFGVFQSAEMDGVMIHAYDSTGSYTVLGWVEDLAVGIDSVQLVVTVN